ncbi:MAG: ABC transporter permease [Candidatus Thermoplasmatota archaeon]|nr:ABC transporter permease [Candidatus Thermoplasmatota archaeon]
MTEPELAVPEGNRQISPPGALERVMGRIAESTISFFRAMSRNRVALAGLLVTFAYFFIALLDVVIPQYLGVSNPSNPISFTTVNYANADKLPSYFNFGGSWWYWLGTTNYNLPILPLMLESLRYDLLYSVAVVLVSLVIGFLAGSLIGFHGGKADEVLMRVVDAFLSIPGIVILITFSLLATGAQQEISAGVLNSPGLVNNLSPFEVVMGLAVITWASFARISRTQAMLIRGSYFVEAAVANGCSRIRVIVSHVMPNAFSPIIAQIPISIANVLVMLVTFEFFFFPLDPGLSTLPELGSLMTGYQYLAYPVFHVYPTPTTLLLVEGYWWPIVVPGTFLVILVIGLNLLAEGLIQYLNPRRRSMMGI